NGFPRTEPGPSRPGRCTTEPGGPVKELGSSNEAAYAISSILSIILHIAWPNLSCSGQARACSRCQGPFGGAKRQRSRLRVVPARGNASRYETVLAVR